ncbi:MULTISPECIES: ABC transporter permease [Kocuria]|jgi:ABC-2 type transport system permease protein|uniref:Transport permease protein n=2 Tax=Kocuria rosea TaxID=1275 RepID=A0A0A6YC72_KOCRO|nr:MULTISPECIES: ABC transporter permease [Kocuria]MCC5784007.1 sugar ABC transporter permease [Kocuria sp. CCUG 69068]EYT51315.1 sugar ABC transporter permease [Kocuria sp. UCD-OTCP]KHD97192.1 sugar ABC transporter permease [Kocuria polaris]MEB2527815.1 ABC transporter permease [Kocuria rosea]MEB2617735.1 ABC transporter permease [Kocuria rosea]
MPAATVVRRPSPGTGLPAVFRQRYLLKLLVDKELQIRYRGTVLGLLWSYVKPGIQFVVFYVALGIFLGLERGMENYAVYLFSGIILINFFSESFGNAARSIVANASLIKKIYLPRQMFPVASVWVAGVHLMPQLVVMLLAALIVGWSPTWISLLAVPAALLIVGLLGAGLGMLFGAANVFFRDAENFVDLIVMVSTWSAPVLYSWTMVRDVLGPVWFAGFMLNPLTVAVELSHAAFWLPTTTPGAHEVPPHLFSLWTPVALLVVTVVMFLGDLLFRRLEGRFAQEL